MDALDQILRLQRIKPSIYFRHSFSTPWGMAIEAGACSQFHIVARGHCVLRLASDGECRPLSSGDIVLLPSGAAHSLLSDFECEPVSGHEVLAAYQRGQPMFNGGASSAELVCGHFDYDRDSTWKPMLDALPDLIHIPAESYGESAEATTVASLLTKEMDAGTGGDSLVAERLAEALFVMTLRAYAKHQDLDHGLLAAICDPRIGHSLSLIHNETCSRFNLDELANEVGMSRSAFSQRFKELLGISPMAYSDSWHLARARHMLRETSLPIVEIAKRIGYDSEPAFHRAFKRKFQATPGQMRMAFKTERVKERRFRS